MNCKDELNSPPIRRIPWLLPALLAVLVAVALARTLSDWLIPAPPVPVPERLESLQPQLRAYIEETIGWVQENPKQMERHATLGLVYAANQLWREAKLAFENAARLRPREPLAHLYVAVATQETGDQDSALDLYRQLTDRFPKFPQGFHRLGEAALRAGLIDEASAAFERLIELAPDEWRGHAGLGEVELRRGNHARAVSHLEQAVAIDPYAGNARSLLGLAYRGLGRIEEAEIELRLGLDSQNYPMPDPWAETAHQHMRLLQDQVEIAGSLSRRGHHDHAIGLLLNALAYAPTNLALLNNLAIALNQADQPERALEVIEKIREIDPFNLAATITASLAFHALGQMDEALAWADQAVARAPNSTQVHLARANAFLGQERNDDALEALEAAARCDPRNPQIQIEIGDLLLRNLDRPEDAFVRYQQAGRLDPSLAGVRMRLARMHIERLEFDDARLEIDRLRKLDPAHPGLPLLEEQLHARSPAKSAASLSDPEP